MRARMTGYILDSTSFTDTKILPAFDFNAKIVNIGQVFTKIVEDIT